MLLLFSGKQAKNHLLRMTFLAFGMLPPRFGRVHKDDFNTKHIQWLPFENQQSPVYKGKVPNSDECNTI